jgi:hypothetical protein
MPLGRLRAPGLSFLSMRLFKYFQFQPRLAVLVNTLYWSATEAVHFGRKAQATTLNITTAALPPHPHIHTNTVDISQCSSLFFS